MDVPGRTSCCPPLRRSRYAKFSCSRGLFQISSPGGRWKSLNHNEFRYMQSTPIDPEKFSLIFMVVTICRVAKDSLLKFSLFEMITPLRIAIKSMC